MYINKKEIEQITELERLIGIGKYLGPSNDGVIFTITCASGFEPHGRASEDWEIIWKIAFPKQQAYWVNNIGNLVKCNDGVTLSFNGRHLSDILSQAIAWFTLYNKQILPIINSKEIANGNNKV